MINPKEIFKRFCKKNKMRYTPERGVIIDEMYRTHAHFDVDKLFLRIRNRYPKTKLSRGSIYRTIPHLIESGLIRESLTEEGRICYEHILGHSHHDHIKCLGCSKVFEFCDEEIDKKQIEICKKRKFKIVSHTHVIYGYCSKCKER